MKRPWTKVLAACLSLFCVLAAPGSDAFQAAAAETVQESLSLPISSPAQIGAVRSLAPQAASGLSSSLSPLGLKATLSVAAAPMVRTQAAPGVLAISVPATAAPATGLSAESPSAQTPTPSYGPIAPAAPSQASPIALTNLSDGAQRIVVGTRQGGSALAQRQAVDDLFLGRGPSAPAGVVDVSPLPDAAPSGLRPALQTGSAAPRAPPQPQRSLARSLRVGWLAAVTPLVITFAATALAAHLGYVLHPGYQSPVPQQITAGTVAATFAMASALAPVSEEMLFRNGLMAGLRRVMRRIPLVGDFWLPALLSSVVFVALHELSDPLLFATRLVHSMILSAAYHKEGLPSSIAAHAFFNGMLMLPLAFSLLPGATAALAGLLALPAAALLTWRALRALKAQAPEHASGRIQPLEITALPSLLLAALLLAGFFLLAHNPVWLLGAVGYLWRGARLLLRRMKTG